MSTMKEKFESHPVVWGMSLIVVGFGAGIAAIEFLKPDAVSPKMEPVKAPKVVNCTIEGIDLIEEGHQLRMKPLQDQLVIFEGKASDQGIITSYQDKYRESANRVRLDIKTENSSYHTAIQLLKRKCD